MKAKGLSESLISIFIYKFLRFAALNFAVFIYIPLLFDPTRVQVVNIERLALLIQVQDIASLDLLISRHWWRRLILHSSFNALQGGFMYAAIVPG